MLGVAASNIAPPAQALSSIAQCKQSMPMTRRRRLLIVTLLLALIPATAGVVFLVREGSLKSRSMRVASGMSRAELEDILGPPYLELRRQGGRGTALTWTDDFWQVNVYLDPDDRAESMNRVPANSWYRRTGARLDALFK